MISFAKQLIEMPVDEHGNIDIFALRSFTEEREGRKTWSGEWGRTQESM